jgi:hypothetical protein
MAFAIRKRTPRAARSRPRDAKMTLSDAQTLFADVIKTVSSDPEAVLDPNAIEGRRTVEKALRPRALRLGCLVSGPFSFLTISQTEEGFA